MYFLFENSRVIKWYNKVFKINARGITVFFLIFLKGEKDDNLKVFNHEKIHIKQFQETLFIGFYIISMLDFLIKFCKYKSITGAYRNLMFEREAYANMDDLDYLKKRKRFAWLRNLFKKKNKVHPM